MKTINITTGKPYSVIIGPGILKNAGIYIQSLRKNCTVAVVSDSTVFPLYGEVLMNSLLECGYKVVHYVFQAGEASKCGETYLSLLNFLAEEKVTRSDFLIALGGGVVGDMTGFCAATYLRGISYVQIPTTLLAAVDSSVGGKTAIDLPSGKNLAGTFHQPSLVLCDPTTLDTLPKDIFLAGCAEVIKYSVLYDADLFDLLQRQGPNFDRETVIARCVELKRDVVQIDEFDTGARQQLNFGHTFGHGVEAHSNFTLSHGFSVAIGMAIITRAAVKLGICSNDVLKQLISLLHQFELPTEADISPEELYLSALSDKKRSGGSINLILPVKIGICKIQTTPVAEIPEYIKAGL